MDGEDGSANMYSTYAAVAVGADEKVLAAVYDEVQPEISFDELGEITLADDYSVLTKRELREDYNLKGASPIGKEWYEQAGAFEDFVVGKTLMKFLLSTPLTLISLQAALLIFQV